MALWRSCHTARRNRRSSCSGSPGSLITPAPDVGSCARDCPRERRSSLGSKIPSWMRSSRVLPVPEDVVFTVEHSVRAAMLAVYHHFDVDKEIPTMYHGLSDPKIAWSALRTAFA
ncbi:hypothetical protein SAMN02787144_101855 [Streptomyces atratus]|uniref:Uncharacterized protein n=2 Tax=Streptomyces atratus TaxID=1893 RepID=A0A1K2EAM1_STRAR|nr:hypothetical protein SAMN02787144_101855 [Streptomyces atratus]